jgi:RecJ-like exonuclease
VKNGEEWRSLRDLSNEEKARIADGIIKERLGFVDPSEIFGDVFILLKRPEFLRDPREFSLLVNACSRLGKSDLALRLCLSDYSLYDQAIEMLEEYRKQITKAISFVRNGRIVEKENGIFILGGREVPDSIIGTVVSLFLSSENINKPIFGLAYDEESNMIKVSARKREGNISLREILVNAVKELKGEAGGHKDAAGAYIPVGKEKEFIEVVNRRIGEANAKKQES